MMPVRSVFEARLFRFEVPLCQRGDSTHSFRLRKKLPAFLTEYRELLIYVS